MPSGNPVYHVRRSIPLCFLSHTCWRGNKTPSQNGVSSLGAVLRPAAGNGSVTFQKIGPSTEPFSPLQYTDTLGRLHVRVGEEAHDAHLPERLSPGLCGYM
jgi:hypothetical protein